MANIQWQPTAFNPIKFNPAGAFATASRSFEGINRILNDRKQQESLAAYRAASIDQENRKQDFVEGAGDRAIAEEQRKLFKSSEKGKLADEITRNAGFSKADAFFQNPENIQQITTAPGFETLRGVGGDNVGPTTAAQTAGINDYLNQGVKQNKRVFSDPEVFSNTIRTKLLESGKFTRQEADEIATQKTTALFPTMHPEIVSKLLQSGSSTGATINNNFGNTGGYGANKLFSGQPSVLEDAKLTENFFAQNPGIADDADAWYEFDWTGPGGSPDLTKPEILALKSEMQMEGISPAATYATMQKQMLGDGNAKVDFGKMSPAQKDAFKIQAKAIQTQMRQGYNSKTGSGGIVGNGGSSAQKALEQVMSMQITNDYNNRVLSNLQQDQGSNQKRMAAILSGLPGGNVQSDAPVVKTPVAATTPPPVVTPAPTVPEVADNILAAPVNEPVNTTNGLLSTPNGNVTNLNDPLNRGFGLLEPGVNTDVKATNNSLRNVRLSVSNPSVAKNLTMKELKMAIDHPGASAKEVSYIQSLINNLRSKNQTKRGIRN